ncbi:MAG: DUF2452 domain-containing protein [Pseudomonadota bacterium]
MMSTTDSTPKRNPNPQGKGLVPVLRDWGALRPSGVTTKPAAQFLRDYAVSALVLSAEFSFRPVVNRTYYLYTRDERWLLSLIGPDEWHRPQDRSFLSSCRLRSDMTWELDLPELADDSPVLDNLRRHVEAFISGLSAQSSVFEELPYYVAHLPYYRRLLASALASSLQASAENNQDVHNLLNSPEVTRLLSADPSSTDPQSTQPPVPADPNAAD